MADQQDIGEKQLKDWENEAMGGGGGASISNPDPNHFVRPPGYVVDPGRARVPGSPFWPPSKWWPFWPTRKSVNP